MALTKRNFKGVFVVYGQRFEVTFTFFPPRGDGAGMFKREGEGDDRLKWLDAKQDAGIKTDDDAEAWLRGALAKALHCNTRSIVFVGGLEFQNI